MTTYGIPVRIDLLSRVRDSRVAAPRQIGAVSFKGAREIGLDSPTLAHLSQIILSERSYKGQIKSSIGKLMAMTSASSGRPSFQ